jgi:hypothetical protein
MARQIVYSLLGGLLGIIAGTSLAYLDQFSFPLWIILLTSGGIGAADGVLLAHYLNRHPINNSDDQRISHQFLLFLFIVLGLTILTFDFGCNIFHNTSFCRAISSSFGFIPL